MDSTSVVTRAHHPVRGPFALGFVALAIFLISACPARAQKVDMNANGMSDIWEALFSAGALNPNADVDGDGVSNALESLAGTNPFDANSVPRFTIISKSGTNIVVGMPSALGKSYTLQSASGLNPASLTNWTTEASQVARTGAVATFSVPLSAAPKFFRMLIADVDSDYDGVNDWEEYVLGLDPFDSLSNGQLDGQAQPITDLAYVQGKLAAQNVVTITATDATATQPDFGGVSQNAGSFAISRGGFPLAEATVNLDLAPPGNGVGTENLDFAALPRTLLFPVSVSSQTLTLTALANTNRLVPVSATLQVMPGTNYTVGSPNNASVVIYPSPTATGTGLTGQYYTNANLTYSNPANFNAANLKFTRIDTNINFVWTTSAPFINNGYFCIRWTGQIQPQFSETYYFVANTDDGVKLWVNDQLIIDSWIAKGASDVIGAINLQGGVRYNIKMEYMQITGGASSKLYWYSASLPKEIIPKSRLYPASVTQASTAITSALETYGFLNQPFSFNVTAANSPLRYNATPLPPGLALNPTTGLLSGVPTLAGDYQLFLTASNALGLSSSVMTLHILDTGSSLTREVWTNVSGINISDIPLGSPASSTNALGVLEGITDFGENYAERITGFLTAPTTANYYFWLAGSDSAELWISNDAEPANKVRRAWVTPTANPGAPPDNGTAPHQWSLQTNQKSYWLALEAGQRYYVEILHKAGVGTNDNWSVGWLLDPSGTNNTPAGIPPSYLLSPYYAPPMSYIPGTLYSANMVAQPGAISSGVGSATLRLSADETEAVLVYSESGLSTPVVAQHIHNDAYLTHPSGIMFDIDAATPRPDGSYVWSIIPVGTLQPADIIEIIKTGKAYINIHTVNYPAGEINGHFTLANGSRTFAPPPPANEWADDHADINAAARFLIQTTFGPSPAEIASVQALGYSGWLSNQFELPATRQLTEVLARTSPDPTTPYPGNNTFNAWWKTSVNAPDQLRQRVAFALSEILVVSENGVLADRGTALSDYYDMLLDNAFGNFRQLLEDVTLHPAMGLYLDMRGNQKGNILTGTHPNENYAREILQLFSVGLNRMWPDGLLVMDAGGNLVPTYDQKEILGYAAMFTGWNYYQNNQTNGRLPTSFSPAANYTNPMVLVPNFHDLGAKRLLDNVVAPPAAGVQSNPANVAFDLYGLNDLEISHDVIFNNQNVGPFICRQLIQRLVTSHPSRDYVYRVVQKFNDNGAGVRGDMKAVLQALFLDYEARSTVMFSTPTFGKQREPVLRVTAAARALQPPQPISGTYTQGGFQTVTVSLSDRHRMTNNETVWLSFTDGSGATAPPSQAYGVSTPNGSNFTFAAPGLLTGTYVQATNVTISNMVTFQIITTNVIFATINGHGLAPGNPVFLQFTSGGAPIGQYQIISSTNGNTLAVIAPDETQRSGNCILPRFTGGGYNVTLRTNMTVSTAVQHGLNVGDNVFLNFTQAGSPADGMYPVLTVPDPTHFTTVNGFTNNQTQNGMTVYPLIPLPLVRSGTVTAQYGTYALNTTDAGTSSSLLQTPIHSPTVFNFFFPDYKFPGALAAAGITTPEFQLTSDTGVALQMNFIEGAILNNGNNTNGLSSFTTGDGDIVLDIGAYMTPAFTSNAGVPSLVDALNTLLCGGQVSSSARTTIINYVANNSNFPYTTPTGGQMRDRVRAVVHLITAAPEFIIQK